MTSCHRDYDHRHLDITYTRQKAHEVLCLLFPGDLEGMSMHKDFGTQLAFPRQPLPPFT